MARKVKTKWGIEGQVKEVEVSIPDADVDPWGMDADLKVVGKRHRRVGGDLVVTGRAKYTFDINLPGMLWGKILRSPYAHAEISSIDLSKAKAMAGVKAVVARIRKGEHVHYAGQDVAAVAAESEEIAAEAARAIEVEYKRLPHCVTCEDSMKDDAPTVVEGDKNVTGGRRPGREEDVEGALKESAATIEATYSTPVQTHSPLESHGVVVRWDSDTSMTCWASTQGTDAVRGQLAQAFKLKRANVRVITDFMGGGFGAKLSPGPFGLVAAEMARETGKPVKIMLDREEEHLATGNRPSSIQKVRAGILADGTLNAWSNEAHGTPGVGGFFGVPSPYIYKFKAVNVKSRSVRTNAGSSCAMRAPGHPEASFATELAVDELCAKAGLDPLEVRRKNDKHAVRQREYEIGAEKIGWKHRPKTGSQTGRVRRGMGLASSRWGTNHVPGSEVQVVAYNDGSLELQSCVQDIGTGTKTVLALIAAEEFGVKPSDIKITIGDTNFPIGPMSGGSVTASSMGPAVRLACAAVKKEVFEQAAGELGAKPEELVCADGRVVVAADPTKSMTWKKAIGLLGGERLTRTGKRFEDYKGFNDEVGGVQFAEVEVDTETGEIRPLKIVAVHDCGRIVNRPGAESQVIGGVIMGLSYGLFEERRMDRQLGMMVNPDFLWYKIAGPMDMPEIEPVLLEMANGKNNVGMYSLGEPPCIPTAGALACAVLNAIGKPVRSLPMTPDRVLEALES